MTAAARADDPWTSWAAAQSVTDIRSKQAAVLHCFEMYGPMSLSQLVATYRSVPQYPRQSDSGIRTRCAELAHRRLVADTGQVRRHDETGRPERVLASALRNGTLFP